MSIFNTDTKQSWASSASAGAVGAQKERATGITSFSARWDGVRKQVAKTFIADPDCVFYQIYLGSNRAFGAATELSQLIDQLVAYAEGAMFASSPAPTLPEIPAHVREGTSVESVKEYQRALSRRASIAAGSTRVGRRLSERGVEAQGKYFQVLSEFMPKYFDLQSSVSLLADASPDFEPIRKLAVEDAVTKANTASETVYGAGRAAQFTVQTAAAASFLLVTNRVPSLSLRAAYRQKFVPEDAEFSLSGTAITWTKGSPALCYVKVGDVVSWAGGTTTITAVLDDSVTLAAPVVAESFEIIPAPYSMLRTFQSTCSAFLDVAPDPDKALLDKLSSFSSVTTIKEILRTLAQIQSDLTGVSVVAQEVFERTGTFEVVLRTPLTTTLKSYNPPVSSQTKEATKRCRQLLEEESLGFSVVRFLQGDLLFLTDLAENQRAASYFQLSTRGA